MQKQDQKPEPAYYFYDYLFCEQCNIWVCYHVYANLKDAGHEGHKIRNPTEEELPGLLLEDEKELQHCAKEDCDGFGSIVDSPEDIELHKGHELSSENIHEGDSYFIHAPLCENCHLEISRIIFSATDETVYSLERKGSYKQSYEMSKHREDDKPEIVCGNYFEEKPGKTVLCETEIEDRVQELINY